MKKLGFFSFTGDEGCMMIFIEALNNHQKWLKKFKISYSKFFGKEDMKNLDYAFIEGAISREEDKKRIMQIRKNCKKLIAMGSCAISGYPSNYRNYFDTEKHNEIKHVLKKFKYLDKVYPLKAFIKVDAEIPGCPMDEKKFIQFMEAI